jgi:hypothetical protein
MALSASCRASAVTSSTTSASVPQRCWPARFFAQAQGSVVAAGPSDHQVERVILDPHHDLLDQGADDPLSGCRRRTGAVPGGLDVGAEVEQAQALGLGEQMPSAARGTDGSNPLIAWGMVFEPPKIRL